MNCSTKNFPKFFTIFTKEIVNDKAFVFLKHRCKFLEAQSLNLGDNGGEANCTAFEYSDENPGHKGSKLSLLGSNGTRPPNASELKATGLMGSATGNKKEFGSFTLLCDCIAREGVPCVEPLMLVAGRSWALKKFSAEWKTCAVGIVSGAQKLGPACLAALATFEIGCELPLIVPLEVGGVGGLLSPFGVGAEEWLWNLSKVALKSWGLTCSCG